MKSKQLIIGGLVLAVCAFQTGCSKVVDGTAKPVATGTASTAKSASKLGDLKPFRQIAADVAKNAEAGDLAAAKLRIKDLEIAWDEAEAGLKPRSAADWRMLDKAIDHALEALRAEPPDANECRQKLSELLMAFDSMN
jgi:hypothetical protein